MWLVICEPHDLPALYAYRGLKARGLGPVELVSPEVLSYSLSLEHRISSTATSVEIDLPGGRRISNQTTGGILNRTYMVPVRLWAKAEKVDRDYVSQELTALYLSWLYSLPCPVINRPTPQGLSGRWRTESEWVSLAAAAGLPTPVFRQSSSDRIDEMKGEKRLMPVRAPRRTVIVANGTVFGDVSGEFGPACCNLAGLSETSLLGIDFVPARGGWVFAGATPNPDLRLGGPALIDALAEALRNGGSD